MSLISIQNLTFGYYGSGEVLFDNASFQIDTDWKLGFVGRNGRGKTTFLRLLQGQYEYQGTIASSVEFDYFPFSIDDPGESGEELADRICPDILRWKLLREMSQLELDEDILYRPVSTLSNGEQTKLLLALLFLRDNRFLLIDEPTNHLDVHGREVLSRYLNAKNGFIVVSHDQAFLDGCVDHVLSINRASIDVQKGNCSSWLENKENQDSFEIDQNEKLKKEIDRLKKSALQKKDWANQSEREKIGIDPNKTEKNIGRRSYLGAKSKKANKRAKAIIARQEAAIEEKSKLLKNIDKADPVRLAYLPYRSDVLAELRDVCVDYGAGPVFSPCSFTIRRGDRISLNGKNGTGKTSLLRILNGDAEPAGGTVRLSGGLKISWLPQDVSGLSGSVSDFAEMSNVDLTMFLTFLRKLGFQRSQFDIPMEQYSMGQKKKVYIAKSLCEEANLYLWDEPLNYVDLLSRQQIADLILVSQPTILFVEHDKRFCERIATDSVYLKQP